MSHLTGNHSDLLVTSAPKPRKCQLQKSYPGQDYGFDLHADKRLGQFIGNVDTNSPAELAGLRRGDRILAINGAPVTPQEHHAEVVRRIKENPFQCHFVVIDEAGFLWYTSRKMTISLATVDDVDPTLVTPPPSYAVVHNSSEDTIDCVSIGGSKSILNNNGSVVHKMNVENGDVVAGDDVKMTVVDVGNYGSSAAAAALTPPPPPPLNYVSLHCDDGESDGLNDNLNVTMPSWPSTQFMDFKCDITDGDVARRDNAEEPDCADLPRLCQLRKSFPGEEYGFNLHAEKNKGHFIGKVDNGSPAQKAGLVQSWRIVGVNDTLIYQKTPHKEVVALIKTDPLQTRLLIVSPDLDARFSEEQKEFSFGNAQVFSPELNQPITEFACAANSVTNGSNHVPFVLHEKELLPEEKESVASENGACTPIHTNGNISPRCGGSESVDIFQMSASQMRERVSRQKKVDPRKESMPLREKYDIIQNL